MSEMVWVCSEPACVQCTMTYRALDKAGVPYTVVDVTENAAAHEYVSDDLGYSAVPIVVIDEHVHRAGFRPDLIAARAPARTPRTVSCAPHSTPLALLSSGQRRFCTPGSPEGAVESRDRQPPRGPDSKKNLRQPTPTGHFQP
ncbi:MAG: glutaredoxin family protein [Microbacteriaceae bacterium]|nr:glutaredoxin family protein [Microbacteriaceae bacterium]